MYNFTIIIPHYNIPTLLCRCVASIPERDDLQIIVVDDCSPDTQDLRDTIDKLMLRNNLEFYYTMRGGSAGGARNVGLDHAKGKWLIFADADDFFDRCLSEIMDKYLYAKEDVIYFNFRSVLSEDILQPSKRESVYNEFFNLYDRDHKEDNFRFLYCPPWGKMIKRSLVVDNNIRFEETRYANDVMFSVLIGCNAKSILPINISAYVLTERRGSLANDFCCKPGETAIRTGVALRVRKTIEEYGYTFQYDYQTYIRILLWNREFKDLFNFYHSIADYGLSKFNILDIVYHTGRRFRFICLWLIWKDCFFIFFKK